MAKHFVECGNSLHIVISSTHLSTGQPTAWFRWHVCCFSLRRPPWSSCQNAKCEGGTASHLKNLSTNNHSVCLCCGSGVPESRPNFTALFNTVISNCWATDRRKWLLEFTRNYRWSKTSRTLSEQLSTRSGTAETWIVFFYHVSKSTYTCLCTQFRLVVSRQHGRSEALVHILYVLSMCAAVSLTLFNPSTPSAPHKRRSGVCASVWPASLHVTSRLLIFM